MATQHQPDKVIASYRIVGWAKDDIPPKPTAPSPSTPPQSTSSHCKVIFTDPTSSLAHITVPGETIAKNRITIHEPQKRIKNVKNYTHVADIVFGNWTATFLSSYDAPAMGILHNADVLEMNENMQKATGWRWEDDMKPLTEKEVVEERVAAIKYGIHKRPRSKRIGLFTLKEKDDEGYHYLALRTHDAAVWEESHPEFVAGNMVNLIAKKLVGGKLLGVPDPMGSAQDDEGGDGDEDEEHKSFAECLESINSRAATIS